MNRVFASLMLVCASVLFAPQSAKAIITIDTVTVGDVGNPNDPSDGDNVTPGVQNYGDVSYAYNIGTTEVTVGQYTAFLNAVAATDTYSLYDPFMATNLNVAGIAQSCASGCTYSVIGSANHPVTYVSWGDAARFANWLRNNQPIGPQNANTTEDGAYTLNGATTNAVLMTVTRNPGATWFIPTENEWYKAAYYQPAAQGGDSDSYWEYPMKTNSEPYSDQPPGATPDNTRVGNFLKNDDAANGYDDGYAVTGSTGSSFSQNYLTDVGAYSSSPSYYGTFDQGGNVWEWNETALNNSARGVRGGAWSSFPFTTLQARSRTGGGSAANGGRDIGFRMASIPEPSTLLLLCFVSLAVLWRRRRVVCAAILVAIVSVSVADGATADTFGSGANSFNIDFVTIGNPGNPADTRFPNANPNPAGSVAYTYTMGKYDVSRDMITKANTLGSLGIPLYDMTPYGGNGVNRPATGVSWNEAARFINWLNTSTGSPPAYKFALQPGDGDYSSNANIQLWTPSDAGYDPANLYRNSLAHYFLPSVDEWYKAAFYDPTSGVYYDYPTVSNSAPTPVASGTAAGTAVYLQPTSQGPADITLAGGLSPYGTMGQGGNVFQLEETAFGLVNNSGSSSRGGRGGFWSSSFASSLSSFDRSIINPTREDFGIGFRVASTFIPEPSSLLLAATASVGLLLRRRVLW